jgi:hypothetical protein
LDPRDTAEIEENVAECLKAALSIIGLYDELFQGKQIFRAFWVRYPASTIGMLG